MKAYTDYSVEKEWSLEPYQSPVAVKVQLSRTAAGKTETVGDPVELNATNGWSYTWEDLETGYEYSVAETDLPEDMESSVNYDAAARKFTITNSTVKAYADYAVQKVWELEPYQSPVAVKVQLSRTAAGKTETVGDPVELNATNNWIATWTDLDTGYEYSVEETGVPAGMETDSAYDPDNRVFTITNRTVVELMDYSVTKRWEIADHDVRVAPVWVALCYSVEGVNERQYGDLVLLNRENDWSHTWTGLDTGYTWRVKEVNVPDGMKAVVTADETGRNFIITNCSEELIDVTARKVWELRDAKMIPDSVNVTLLRNGEAFDTVTLTAKTGWTHTWEDLDAWYQWTVEETVVPEGMISTVEQEGNTFAITNRDEVSSLPDTGDHDQPLVWLLTGLTACAALLLMKRRTA